MRLALDSESQSESSSLSLWQIDSDKNLEKNKINSRCGRVTNIIQSMFLGDVSHSFGHKRELGKFRRNVDSGFQAEKSDTVSNTAEVAKKEGKQDFVPKIWERMKAYSEELSSTSPIEDKVGVKENFFLGAKETDKNMARLDLACSNNAKATPTLMSKSADATFNSQIIFEPVGGKEEFTRGRESENCSLTHQGDMNYMVTSIEKTKAGPVLIAINPYKSVPLFGNDILESTWKVGDTPHVYNTADIVFRAMRRAPL